MAESEVYLSFRDLLTEYFGLNVSGRELISLAHRITLDGYAYSATEVYVGRTRFCPTDEDLDEFLRILGNFHGIFPFHKKHKVYGVFAAGDVPEGIRTEPGEKACF